MGDWSGRKVTDLRRQWARRLPLPCARCGTEVYPSDQWDLDHLTPRSQGGGDGLNLWPSHASCNRSHGARLGNGRGGRGGHRPW